ncbi:hypothetical protein TNCV_2969331 [Trichonephila clavipes]|nr:hypothetical protein TNCV_2969331 [Trichonephila clavipes]
MGVRNSERRIPAHVASSLLDQSSELPGEETKKKAYLNTWENGVAQKSPKNPEINDEELVLSQKSPEFFNFHHLRQSDKYRSKCVQTQFNKTLHETGPQRLDENRTWLSSKALGCIYSIELEAEQTAKRGNCRITIDRQGAAPNQSFRASLAIDIAASRVTNGEEERNCFTLLSRISKR